MSHKEPLGLGRRTIVQKIVRKLNGLKGTPKSIAEGFATGAAVSFTPLVGFHILISLIIAKITKQNGVAATLGTIVGNPWTFPFIWYSTLHTGHFLLGHEASSLPINFKMFFKELFHAVITLDFSAFISDILPIFLPMLVGCIPYCIIVWLLFFYLIKKALATGKQNRETKDNDIRTRL